MNSLKAIAIRRSFEQLARRIESRYALNVPPEDLRRAHSLKRGSPHRGSPRLRLRARTVKMPAAMWKALDDAVAHAGVTASALLCAMVQDLQQRHHLGGAIRRLRETGLLLGELSRSA